MKTIGIPITLDRPRTLLLDAAAFELIKQSTGIDVKGVMREALERDGANGFPLTLDITRGLIFAGCLTEDSRLTLETVSQFVTLENYESFHMAIAKSIARGHGIPYTPSQETDL